MQNIFHINETWITMYKINSEKSLSGTRFEKGIHVSLSLIELAHNCSGFSMYDTLIHVI